MAAKKKTTKKKKGIKSVIEKPKGQLTWTNPLTGKRETRITQQYPGQPKAINDINHLWTMMMSYVEWAIKDEDEELTMAGLAVYIGVNKDTLNQYRIGSYDTDTSKYSEAIEYVRTIIESKKLNKALRKEYDSGITKFDLINNHGYKDKVIQQITGSGGGAIQVEDVSDTEFIRRFLWMLEQNSNEKVIEGEII